MDTKKLRQKILDLAIRGKLVPQDPNDEPASVLLERIRAEKEQLIKEGKIKRSKKSAATDKSHYENVPFEIPENWCWTTLGDVFNLQAGKNITAKEISDKQDTIYPFPCYGGNGLRGYVSSYNRTGRFPLIGRQGALCGNINVADGLFYATEHAVVVESYCNIDVDWAVYALIYLNLNQHATSTAQPGLSVATINEVLLPVPPIDEQKRIANEIEKWFDLIKEIESGKVELESYIKQTKSKILDLAISGKLVPQDPNDETAIELLKRINPNFHPCDNSHYENLPFEIPSTWVWVSHNDMLEISGGAQPPKSEFSEVMKPGYIRLYQIRDYGEKPIPIYIPLSTASKTTVKGDILLARYGGSLGKVFIAEDGAYNVAMAKVILCYPEVLNQKFVYYYYLSSIYQNKLRSISRTAQAGFNSGDFEDMYFPLPPLEEQGRIVDAISSIWEMIDMITAEL